MIDLSQEDLLIVKEIAAAEHQTDHQNEVITGIDEVVTNNSSSHYLDNSSLYRSFNELDLRELLRIRRLPLRQDMGNQRFDTQALFA